MGNLLTGQILNMMNTASVQNPGKFAGQNAVQELQSLKKMLLEKEDSPSASLSGHESVPTAESENGKRIEEHPGHEGACVQSPEGVRSDSREGEAQPSLEPNTEAVREEQPENLLKAEAPPMQRQVVMPSQFRISAQELRRSFIISEILGKPLSLRRKSR